MSTTPFTFGTIRIIPDDTSWVAEAVGPNRAGQIRSELCVWRPPAWTGRELPLDFSLTLRCATFPDGIRRFYPVTSFDDFIATAFAGGLALLCGVKNLSAEQRSSYREGFLLFQRLRGRREHLRNKLIHSKSLRVAARGRGLEDEWSVLPDRDEFLTRGGRKLSVAGLISRGGGELRSLGWAKPTLDESVVQGLTGIARSAASADVPAQDVPGLVRSALYEAPARDPARQVGPAQVDVVRERLHRALSQHLEDEEGDFRSWFRGSHINLVGQLCQGTRAMPGRLDRDVVNRVLFDLGWEAYAYVADCVLMMMWAVAKVLPQPLDRAEEDCFAGTYYPQAHFGGLPLVLLTERFALLEPVIWQLWASPQDEEAIRVLHRLLAYYAEMSRKRREVDRQVAKKTGTIAKDEVGPEVLPPGGGAESRDGSGKSSRRGGREVSLPDDMADDRASSDEFAELASCLREFHAMRCDCPRTSLSWDATAEDFSETVVVWHSCRQCGFHATTTTPLDTFKGLMGMGLE